MLSRRTGKNHVTDPPPYQNIARDRRNVSDLMSLGGSVSIIWECSVRNRKCMEAKLKELITTGVAGKSEMAAVQ